MSKELYGKIVVTIKAEEKNINDEQLHQQLMSDFDYFLERLEQFVKDHSKTTKLMIIEAEEQHEY